MSDIAAKTTPTAPAEPARELNRAACYLAKVDKHLLTVDRPEGRLAFLRVLTRAWHGERDKFFRGELPEYGADAADYLLTVDGLESRLNAELDAMRAAVEAGLYPLADYVAARRECD